jgi:tetratricopeptide (TPR) repeat protein
MHAINPHLQRTEMLLSQQRYDLAEREARQAIGADPQQALGYSYLAICLSEREEWQPATEAAQRAVGLEPDEGFHHYVLARVYNDRTMYREARAAIGEALRLDPESPANWAMKAAIDIGQKKFRDALEAADRGLEHDAEHEGCINLRAMALTNLGQRGAAGAAIDSTLARNPLNPNSHANMGWTLLHERKPREAMEHFREALRLEPNYEWARAGIVEAMKARSPIYRVFLAYFLFMMRLPAGAQWGILIGAFVLFQVARNVRASNPDLALYLTPVVAGYLVFAIGSIVAYPLFNLLLFTDRFGRYALDRAQRVGAAVFGLTLIPPVVFVVLWAGVGGAAYQTSALLTGLLAIPVALAGLAGPGQPRLVMSAIAVGLGGLCAYLVIQVMQGGSTGGLLFLYSLGCFASTWVANGLATAPARAKR